MKISRIGTSLASVVAIIAALTLGHGEPAEAGVDTSTPPCDIYHHDATEYEVWTYRPEPGNGDHPVVYCHYADQRSWMLAAKDAIASGVQRGSGTPTVEIRNLRTNGNLDVVVNFVGRGSNAAVQTQLRAGFGGASGWVSATESPCRPPFVTATGSEGTMIRDFAYHIAQVVKTHDQAYNGSVVVGAAKLIAASGTTVVYNGAGCNAS